MNLELVKDEVFEIEGRIFKLKDDLTLDESEEATNLLNLFFSASSTMMIATANSGDIKKFLGVVLAPIDGKPLSEDFNFGKARESVLTKIVMFFLFPE